MHRRSWFLARFCWPAMLLLAAFGAADAAQSPQALGERIYLQGMLPNDGRVQGQREQGGTVEGTAAACVGCHKRSGLGSGEGTIRIPPITSRYLFNRVGVQAGRPTLDERAASDASRAAYDETSLAAAIRRGVGRGGRALSYLMPRYALDDAGMKGLITYLKSLPTQPAPGVSEEAIDFATVFTPDVDPKRRDAVLAVLNQFIADKNAFLRGGARGLQSQAQIDFRVTRRWQLHVWQLTGPAEAWEQQLTEHLRREPVFAVLSGLGGADWSPVHRFCEREHLPCLFPNVLVPVEAEHDFYSMYFSKGILLEADAIATQWTGAGERPGAHRLVQLYSGGDGSERAARRLEALRPAGWASLLRPIAATDSGAVSAAGELRPGDVLVLWLGADALARLGAPPPKGVAVFVSGTLGGLEHAPLQRDWRSVATMVYPFDLPGPRAVRLSLPLRWFQIQHIPVIDERLQADTYLACGIVSEALKEMQDSFMRDYLLERIESMVSHRQLSGYYPRLGLAAGQRFASKGAYLVHFAAPDGTALVADGEWLVP